MRHLSNRLLATAAAFSLTAFGGAALAQESPVKEPAEAAGLEDSAQEDEYGIDVSFNVGVSTDYMFRGIQQTDDRGQLFGGVDATFGGNFYAGAWASNIDYSSFGDKDTNLEVDVYAGVKPEAAGFVFDLGVIYYTYHNQPSNAADLNFTEFKLAASRAIGPASFGGAIYYSPEFSGEIGDATYYEVNGVYTFDKITVSGAIGRQELETDFDYATLNVGATYALTDNFGIDLRYHTTDEDGFGDAYDDRLVASLKAVF